MPTPCSDFQKNKEQRARRREAKLAFLSLFNDDLDNFKRSREDTRKILSGKEDVYNEEKSKIRTHLYFWQKKGFDKAWEEFLYHPDNKSIPFLEQYFDFDSLNKRKNCQNLLKNQLDTPLQYATISP